MVLVMDNGIRTAIKLIKYNIDITMKCVKAKYR